MVVEQVFWWLTIQSVPKPETALDICRVLMKWHVGSRFSILFPACVVQYLLLLSLLLLKHTVSLPLAVGHCSSLRFRRLSESRIALSFFEILGFQILNVGEQWTAILVLYADFCSTALKWSGDVDPLRTQTWVKSVTLGLTHGTSTSLADPCSLISTDVHFPDAVMVPLGLLF